MNDWLIYHGTGKPDPRDGAAGRLPDPPSWRQFGGGPLVSLSLDPRPSTLRRLGQKAAAYRASDEEVEMVNAALYLRRPLLVTGKPGTGKSTLAHSVARELELGPVLTWPITSRSNRQEGLYTYDALARLQDASLAQQSGQHAPGDIGRYIRLGPLGTALLPYARPRVLLIDELDKSDIDLPNDLLTLFEEGEYEIPELARIAGQQPAAEVRTHDAAAPVTITDGKVTCHEFPLVIITSNGERDFPPPFLRRCLRLNIRPPEPERLAAIVRSHLGDDAAAESNGLIDAFIQRRTEGDLATDQLLNAIYLAFHRAWPGDRDRLVSAVMQHLNSGAPE